MIKEIEKHVVFVTKMKAHGKPENLFQLMPRRHNFGS